MSNKKYNSIRVNRYQSNGNYLSNEGLTSEPISGEKISQYLHLQGDQLKSRALILSKRYNISIRDSESALRLADGDYSKVISLIDYIVKLEKINPIDFLDAFITAYDEGTKSLHRKPISLLEEEVMDIQNVFNIDPNERELNLIKMDGGLKPAFTKINGRNVPSTKEFKFSTSDLYREDVEEIRYFEKMIDEAQNSAQY